MKVRIIEAATNLCVGEQIVIYGLVNSPTTNADLIDEAWNAAVEDKTVVACNRANYRFTISQ